MEYAQRIGARIARLRTEKHLTQGQLAQAAGVPRDALARWEAGGGLPGRAELTALARPLGTTAAALLSASLHFRVPSRHGAPKPAVCAAAGRAWPMRWRRCAVPSALL